MNLTELIETGAWVPSATEFRDMNGVVWAQVAQYVDGEGRPLVFVSLSGHGELLVAELAQRLADGIKAAITESGEAAKSERRYIAEGWKITPE
jgi:hypothetical protein